jgi:hypothetical protein
MQLPVRRPVARISSPAESAYSTMIARQSMNGSFRRY